MPNPFERMAMQRLIDKATAAGVSIPDEVTAILHQDPQPYPARWWATHEPDDERAQVCGCEGCAYRGPEHCTAWTPVYDEEQADPRPPAGPQDLAVADGMCTDCAFRPGSPERADAWAEEALLALADDPDTPFWCHQGMRRPARWEHPDGRVVDGSPDDWQPPVVAGVPYRADGSPGLLCAGWAAIGQRNRQQQEVTDG